ncbi:anti-sigma-factor antagonist (STAS) domain protein [Rhodoferax ferrireducens T118]|uniref:Anti-sigma-factor antagonist (STAS) domain protein n=1 Tax=Albidiferax ferrireducens (strain ATCC BAA-621 / DSM 15236 / T118) TaxID=338969 RepID=Q220A5_ALBFT|nr:STAS domain-containing protein [Rhodoferax ferrireducens]ABD68648.1 anti-sigma-factor antagonist (STAS) domain protein [Rhodoferax ferrireducens T118]
MTSETKPTNEPSVLRIEGELTIFRAAELKPLLLAEPMAQAIDLSGVTELDTAGVQLLMLAKKMALATQRKLSLVAHSPAVIEVFELLNLAAYFGDPLVMTQRRGGAATSSTSNATGRSYES